ncbi:MAG: phosphate/phosphite/phosphonate ABC transporter substrate-binding protein [Burkholderiaceae bacterium]|nr:phosphate/phosphite/phosphonate ABC transporter substrate-binding protein [Burkholderiaceae bacterium]
MSSRVTGPIGFVSTLLAAAFLFASNAGAQTCASRGDLDPRYCDANGDLLADAPADKSKLKNPDTLVFSYTPVEDPSVYENSFSDLMAHIGKVTGKRIRWYAAESYAAQVEALRSGRLHITGVASGATPYAVNLGGFVPQVAMEKHDGTTGYTLQLITHRDSPIKSVADLKGKRVAHVSPSSNSGDTAPRVLFAALGIKPGTDYEIVFSGKHDNSIMGVVNKDYDAAPVANNVVDRMRERGLFKKEDLRVVYESRPFPRTAFGVAHDLAPELQEQIRQAFITFDFKASKLAKEFKDSKAFIKIDYAQDWKNIRDIQKATGATYTAEGLTKLKKD